MKSALLLGTCFLSVATFVADAPQAYAQSGRETEASKALIRLDALEAQIRDLTNRVETLEAENSSLKQAIANGSTGAQTTTSISKPIPQETTPALADTVSTQKPDTNTAAEAPSPNLAVKPEDAVKTATVALQAGDYDSAEKILANYTETTPDAKDAPQAYWLLGETRYVQQSWGPAAQAYVAYLQKAPTGPKVSDILVRLAGTFRELGDNGQRCKALQSYKERTPNPPAILKARADAEIAKAPC